MTEWLSSYAQCGEDVLLWRALRGIEQGFYIDIGAYDPSEDSVTRLFYEAGWSGINIEPNPRLHMRLMQKRPRDVNLDVAVSDSSGEMTLNLVGETGLTTLFSDLAAQHQSQGWAITQITVQTRRLADIWDEHVPPGRAVHFLKIDAEGAETLVIKGADWARHRPWIVVVEAVEPNSRVESHAPWEPILQGARYDCVHFDGLNRYYVDKDHPELMEALRPPLNMATDRFWPAPVLQARDEAARLAARCDQLQAQIDRLGADLTEAQDLLDRRPRPLWEKIGFTTDGAPKPWLRWVLFDAAGRPRDRARKWVIAPDGRPHAVFHRWMAPPPMRARADSAPRHALNPAPSLSPRAQDLRARIAKATDRT